SAPSGAYGSKSTCRRSCSNRGLPAAASPLSSVSRPENRDLDPEGEHGPIRVVDQDGGDGGEESNPGGVDG
ncbi:MAG: hypothetical protein LC777_21185, partial [Actinobacteria bacterium]|nr:hypothetical protein [Actinomycetota bacterium]